MVIGLLSVGGLASTVAPAFSDPSDRLPAEWSPVRLLDGSVDGRGTPLRLAQADADRDHGWGTASDRDEDRAGPQGGCRNRGHMMGGMMGHMGGMGGMMARMGPHGYAHRGQSLGLVIAARLAQTETYVGITSAQLDVWRAYSSALIGFFERPGRDQRPGGPGPAETPPAQSPQGEAAPAPANAAPALFADRLADRAIARADKARALKTAVDALRAQLTPEQLDRLAKAERAFLPRRGPHDRNGPRHEWRADMEQMSPEDMTAQEDMSEEPEDMPAASPEDMPSDMPGDMPSEMQGDMPTPEE